MQRGQRREWEQVRQRRRQQQERRRERPPLVRLRELAKTLWPRLRLVVRSPQLVLVLLLLLQLVWQARWALQPARPMIWLT